MKKILFPTDFSETASNAFVHALEFANWVNAELILLHTFEIPVADNQFFPENYAIVYDSIEFGEFDQFQEEVKKLRAIAEERNLQNILMSHRLMYGNLESNIKHTVKDESIDYLVMGTSGASGWGSFFIGTNTVSVVANTVIPVYSVPLSAKYKPIQTIGFTTRFGNKDKKAFHSVLDLANKTNVNVKCIYIKTSNSSIKANHIAKWKEGFNSQAIEYIEIESDDLQDAILKFVNNYQLDFLTMLPHKRSFWSSIFNFSLTQKMVTDFEIPILSIPIE